MTGFHGRTPCLRFIGKADHIVDMRGEKLSEGFVASVLREVLTGIDVRFAMLAPQCGQAAVHYTLFLSIGTAPPEDLPARLDDALARNPHYRYCRTLGQLARPRLFLVAPNAAAQYVAHQVSLGRRMGDVKVSPLSALTDWERVFSGALVPVLSPPTASRTDPAFSRANS